MNFELFPDFKKMFLKKFQNSNICIIYLCWLVPKYQSPFPFFYFNFLKYKLLYKEKPEQFSSYLLIFYDN